MTLDTLIARQNPDGGWPYSRGSSWTEPTVYAILALLAAGERGAALGGVKALLGVQRPDGGWPPQASVAESCWVTALVALLPPEHLGTASYARAIDWLLDVTGVETTTTHRLRAWLLGNKIPPEQQHPGWPWVPGSAAWVAPSALAILALQKQHRRHPSPRLAERIESGRQFLISRACAEGGWNHGGVPDLGDRAHAYADTTGMALVALRGASGPRISRALAVAQRLLAGSRSADAVNWLYLGLMAHGALPAGYRPPAELAYRTMPEVSLRALVAGAEAGHSFLWD
jgi:hypothetical protein